MTQKTLLDHTVTAAPTRLPNELELTERRLGEVVRIQSKNKMAVQSGRSSQSMKGKDS